MSDANLDNAGDGKGNPDGGQESVETLKTQLAALQGDLEKANGEAAKHRKLAKDAQAERDLAKREKGNKGDEDYKKLWEDEQNKSNARLEKVRKSDVNTAAVAQLAKAKVDPKFAEAAMKLLDHSLIEWDEDGGVDSPSVTAAVQKLKSAYPAFFEGKVGTNDVKDPAGGSQPEKTLKRAEFDKLSPAEKHDRMSKGWKLVD